MNAPTDSPPTPRPRFRGLRRFVLLVLGPAVVIVAGLYVYMISGRYVTTENAYVKSDLIIVTPEVSGFVAEILVAENQRVKAGDVLFRLEPHRFLVARDRRAAELAAARRQVEAAKARHRAKRAELDAAITDASYLRDERDRSEALWENRTIPETTLMEARRVARQADGMVAVAAEEIVGLLADLGGDPDLDVDDHPSVAMAQADLAKAEFDLEAAIIRAPADGVAGNVRLQAGEYVEEGDPVMSLVASGGFWIEANLKETDLTHLREGNDAEFVVDAYPDIAWTARVDSLSPATGAEYALLPPQNASGNWVKVVQRVPVRLAIAPNPDAPPLRTGMSVHVSIDTQYERPLPELLNSARAWIVSDERR